MGYQYRSREVIPRPDREFRIGNGRISGYGSLFLGSMSLAAVLAYLYPAYLTTRELRAGYDAELLQEVLKYSMWLSLFLGTITLIINRKKRLGVSGIIITLVAFALGGYNIPLRSVAAQPLSLGVDWLILTFLGSTLIFTALEKIFPKYRYQLILRDEWELDFGYFCFNHLLISAILLVGNFVVAQSQWAMNNNLHQMVQSLPLTMQVLGVLICADFVLYWEHRTYHEIPRLWAFHAVHHSIETLDWLAGSRSHVAQVFIERTLVMVTLYFLGADQAALDIYVAIAALQAIVIHCNLGFSWGIFKYLFVTPQYHHWHHSSEQPAIDTNYAAHTPLFDLIFGTYHLPGKYWPAEYGTTDKLPRTFIGQFLYPFENLFK
jgi:sterol desaturase/sphingolipid hydroxylase (fatty acid hydroxylase superfamily)